MCPHLNPFPNTPPPSPRKCQLKIKNEYHHHAQAEGAGEREREQDSKRDNGEKNVACRRRCRGLDAEDVKKAREREGEIKQIEGWRVRLLHNSHNKIQQSNNYTIPYGKTTSTSADKNVDYEEWDWVDDDNLRADPGQWGAAEHTRAKICEEH